jgi:NAD dependent epimerase/dehydratase family enzyme
MKIVICGSSGLIGKVLINELKKRNHSIVPLINESNKLSGKKDFTWDIFSKKIDIQAFSEADCVVNLAGSNIAQSWSEKNKKSIYKLQRFVRYHNRNCKSGNGQNIKLSR